MVGLRKLLQNGSKLFTVSQHNLRRNLHTSLSAFANNITRIKDNEKQRLVKITWEDGKENLYPHLFLRDHCQCAECFHPATKSRRLDTVRTVDLGIKISDIKFEKDGDGEGDKVTITWPDHHTSVFYGDWLLSRALPKPRSDSNYQNSTGLLEFSKIQWDRDTIKGQIPYVDYEQLTNDDAELKKHIEHLFQYGFSIIKNAPKDFNVLSTLAKLMCLSVVTKTNYG